MRLSPEGRSAVVRGPERSRMVPGWGSLYVASSHSEKTSKVYRFNIQTGKMDSWKTFGAEDGAGVTETGAPIFSSDGSAYAYVYVRVLSEAYLVTGLK